MVFLVLAAEIACLLVIVVLLVRGFRKRGHVVAVALAALLMGLVPSVSDGEWVRGIGQGLSFALLTVLGGVAFGSPGDHPVLTSRGSMTAGVSALLLSLAAATLWTFLPEGKLWLGVAALVAAGACQLWCWYRDGPPRGSRRPSAASAITTSLRSSE